jgi:hypothetical protein
MYLALRAQPVWPSFRDLFAAVASAGAMCLALAPLRGMTPGFGALVVQVAVGALVYGALVLAFDIAGLRALALAWLRARPGRAGDGP